MSYGNGRYESPVFVFQRQMTEKKFVLALDQGTTSSRAILFDREGKPAAQEQMEFRQLFPESGWVEHDPLEILESQVSTAVRVLDKAGVDNKEVAAVGITNQRETAVLWDRGSGAPVSNAIVWQDRRTAESCRLKRESHGTAIRQKTGLETDPYFSASKIEWLLDNVDGARERAEAGELAFGTVDSWLVWNLTGGAKHVTDVSNASRTMLFNINSLEWDEELLSLFRVPRKVLPAVCGSSQVVGDVSEPGELKGIPIAGIAGDQQAALFGQRCFSEGDAKSTYGTGCFLLQNTGGSPSGSKHRLLTTIGWESGDRCRYALEGSVFIGGAVIQWLRDSLGIIATASEVERLAQTVDDTGGVYFVPAFSGLGTPYWDPHARGLISGLTRGTNAAHLARAALEAIAFQTTELLLAMEADSGKRLPELKVDGGASANDLLMQMQADLLQIPVVRGDVTETTALGAAFLAGLAVGFWKDQEEILGLQSEEVRFVPSIPNLEAEARLGGWRAAVELALGWAK